MRRLAGALGVVEGRRVYVGWGSRLNEIMRSPGPDESGCVEKSNQKMENNDDEKDAPLHLLPQ